ncbi:MULTISPECIES: 2-succinyl-5-enolpyruvyl-6-hydroxy-3-cyclohexene-1-carboxylic-acid synthase [unclassified Microbacterium]|uniref:2-succinyl-5-enolpyruvyl-6-hydroxy-3- cyclohexene-1-carboxylic-acid synthase n=1 Tax=unclassified Microbacterium TaxID=2609290 RepID=UPI000EA8ABB8|nr:MULTISPECIES: 2-succinyl-5-enolpyruvyl-6-hydroxy-3-cyclohexene-1-carboxylic-acid synthase [unclassified Microbacterium]MBT2483384.1 2-succinyl-5-enolpyruvyl-6-hydroxy-3-cyclohexene-1-carboxylic-acid synthase [Microbacterium sp. ISL-108]RKN66416.1 2-succinyl-5-enolpyruvyl-6-hydroxy-3-cyclohexene-1-carboxylic-acid synthase [Microbacterium sp. CGR2]
MTSSPATGAAATLIAELVAHGVRDIVLSPGSRSQALALAAVRSADAQVLRVHVRIDERVAGFTALGIGRETGVPAAVICTSGTAVANLLPAVMEAYHSGVPLLLLTADRPPELLGVGANQATIQEGIFDRFVRAQIDAPVPGEGSWDGLGALAVATAVGERQVERHLPGVGGPVHLNLPSREPLSGEAPDVAVVAGDAPRPPAAAPFPLARGPLTVVIAGADAGPDAEQVAHDGGWPLIAEVVSGARFGRQLVHGYRRLLRRDDLGGRIQRAVVLGHPTLSREVAALLSRAEVEVVAVHRGGEQLDLNGRTRGVPAVTVESGAADREWLGAWLAASAEEAVDLSEHAPDPEGLASTDFAARREAVKAELDAVRRPLDRELLVDAVWRATWPHDRLMFGSSRLVRVADGVLGGKKVPVHANRGLAGIDGTIATATGIALASQAAGAPGVTRVLLGDLAFLHDVGALLLPPDEAAPRLQVIVGNDGGGTIFDSLEVAASASPTDLDRAFYTPHSVQLQQLALAYGWDYQQITTRTALDQALTAPRGGRQLIEVPLAR